MPNELILILSVILIYAMVFITYVLFAEKGLICWTVIATITANIEVMLLIRAFGMSQTLGNVLFASTFLVTDILSEMYGKKEANKAVSIGIFSSACFLILSQFWFLFTPDANDWAMPHFQAIFSNTPRIMIVGLLVYAIVQRFDVWCYHVIWGLTAKLSGSTRSFLWIRNNVATLISQFLNTLLFTFGAFWGIYDLSTLGNIIVASYIIFIFTTLLDTPIVYMARRWHDYKVKKAAEK